MGPKCPDRTVQPYGPNCPNICPKCPTLWSEVYHPNFVVCILRRVVYVYTMKIKGPRTQPCMGTPQEEVFEEDRLLSHLTCVTGPVCASTYCVHVNTAGTKVFIPSKTNLQDLVSTSVNSRQYVVMSRSSWTLRHRIHMRQLSFRCFSSFLIIVCFFSLLTL